MRGWRPQEARAVQAGLSAGLATLTAVRLPSRPPPPKRERVAVRPRVAWIDTVRGLGILFVVLGHTCLPRTVAFVLFSFHMPLFFFVSGMLFLPERWTRYPPFVRRRTRALLLPYVAFYALLYLYYVVIGSRFGETVGGDLLSPLVGFVVSSFPHLADMFFPMWFLTCLFVVENLFFWLYRLLGRRWSVLGLALCGGLGWLSSLYLDLRFPWSADTALTAVVFYGAGFYFRPLLDRVARASVGWHLAGLAAFAVFNAIAVAGNDGVSLAANHYGSYALFLLGAFAGIGGCLVLAQGLASSGALGFIGRNSLVLYACHLVALGIIRAAVTALFDLPIVAFDGSILWAVWYTAAATIALVPMAWLTGRHFPFILGRLPRPRAARR